MTQCHSCCRFWTVVLRTDFQILQKRLSNNLGPGLWELWGGHREHSAGEIGAHLERVWGGGGSRSQISFSNLCGHVSQGPRPSNF